MCRFWPVSPAVALDSAAAACAASFAPANQVQRGGRTGEPGSLLTLQLAITRRKTPLFRNWRKCGRGDFAGGPDVETAVRTTGLLTAGRNRGTDQGVHGSFSYVTTGHPACGLAYEIDA